MIIVVQDKNSNRRERISTGTNGIRINMTGVINPRFQADSNMETQFHANANASMPNISEFMDDRV
jgi:hypothetical protein